MTFSVTMDVPSKPGETFDRILDQLVLAIGRQGMKLIPEPQGGVFEGTTKVGRITSWTPGKEVKIEWYPKSWEETSKAAIVSLHFEPLDNDGTCVTLQVNNWNNILEESDELVGWFATEIIPVLFKSMSPERFGDWLTDRWARRPIGEKARTTYRNPTYHRPNFLAIMDALQLKPNDYLLEVGCGGGAFLHDALATGCKAAAIDHSPEMVRLARQMNEESIRQNRLVILEAEADRLPYNDEMFTCAVMTSVFGLLSKPAETVSEIWRTLRRGGRLIVFMTSKEVKGTIAAPEPVASRVRFYEDDELEELARKAGFRDVRVERPDLAPYARKLNLPEDVFPTYSDKRPGQLLIARKI